MIIRDFKLSDLDDVLSIEYEAFPDPYPSDIIVKLHENGAGFIVAELGEHVVGYMIFWVKDGIGHIIVIAVNSNFRGQGIGSKLLERCLKIFMVNKIFTVNLEVRKSNLSAINFYVKHGFVRVYEEENYYSDNESAIIMRYNRFNN